MNSERSEKISGVFVGIFEKLAFMFGDEVSKDEIPVPTGDLIEASMSFTGFRSGSLGLALPRDVCPVISANVLGIDVDDDVAIERSLDALKEVLNVICGNLLTEIEGEEPIFDLTVPETRIVSKAEWAGLLENDDTMAFVVDEEPVLLYLRIGE